MAAEIQGSSPGLHPKDPCFGPKTDGYPCQGSHVRRSPLAWSFKALSFNGGGHPVVSREMRVRFPSGPPVGEGRRFRVTCTRGTCPGSTTRPHPHESVAQWRERRSAKPEAAGSTPARFTTFLPPRWADRSRFSFLGENVPHPGHGVRLPRAARPTRELPLPTHLLPSSSGQDPWLSIRKRRFDSGWQDQRRFRPTVRTPVCHTGDEGANPSTCSNASVSQSAEESRREREQCGFESRPEHHAPVPQSGRGTRSKSRGSASSSLAGRIEQQQQRVGR